MYLQAVDNGKHLRPSDPQLPRTLWDGFEKDFPDSFIFTPSFSDIRHRIVSQKWSPNSAVPIGNQGVQVVESGRFIGKDETAKLGIADVYESLSYLHLAALHGDLPLAYEARRLGTSVRVRNKDKFSALYFGCRTIFMFIRPKPSDTPDDTKYMATVVDKIRRVCLFLLFQHSDPNETHGGISLLHFASQSNSWELVRALLLHGADASPVQGFATEADKARFLSLVSEFKNSTTGRPRRLCSCASGLPLEECHAVSGGRPYPEEYICCCGSRKIYSACCGKRTGMEWREEWNETADRLQPKQIVFLRSTFSPSVSKGISDREISKMFEGIDGAVVEDRIETFRTIQAGILRDLEPKGRVDPAYVAGIKEAGILVPYHAAICTVSKGEWKETTGMWNGAVDTYIASGVDPRPREIIENAAKISLTGGPLYRKCEASGCANVDGRGSVRVSRCTHCKTAVYCGKDCQKSAWKGHKSACQSGTAKHQLLPSQLEHLREMARATNGSLYLEALY